MRIEFVQTNFCIYEYEGSRPELLGQAQKNILLHQCTAFQTFVDLAVIFNKVWNECRILALSEGLPGMNNQEQHFVHLTVFWFTGNGY